MPRRRQKKEGSPASPPRGRSQARTPDSSPRRRGAAPSPKTRALAFLATPPPVSMPPRPALALAYEDAAARELALDVAYESDETSEDPRLLPAIATEIEAYDDPKQISPGYSTSEGEDEACRLGCGDLSPYSTSEDEDHAAPLRGAAPCRPTGLPNSRGGRRRSASEARQDGRLRVRAPLRGDPDARVRGQAPARRVLARGAGRGPRALSRRGAAAAAVASRASVCLGGRSLCALR